MELKNLKINFLGDSITEGHGSSSPENCYVSKVAEYTGALCRNYGIGGTRIARQQEPSEIAQFDFDFCQRVADMDPDADVVIVFGGTNDYDHGDAPIGEFADRTPDTFYGALHTLYTSLIEKYSDSYIIVITPLHRIDEDVIHPCKGGVKAPLKKYVEIIREVAEYYSLPIIDLYAMSGMQPEIPIIKEKFMADGLHPTDLGHKIIAKKVVAFLKNTVI